MLQKLPTYITIFLALFCIILFFEGVYSSLTRKERRSWLGIAILTMLISSAIIILETIGFISITIACW
jgi:uncharacterized membrane protein YccC